MCGIVGFATESCQDISVERILKTMTAAIAHRGPDDQGHWVNLDRGFGFGHVRLSILDLSVEGHQPMASASGRFLMVFNGEVYNYQEFRSELIDLGHSFRGRSDTEAMLAAFEEWGVERALKRFNGMFAFAVWDRKEDSLILARDRLGVKPLYYGWNENQFFFSSELKAIRSAPSFRSQISRDALALYFRYGRVPSPFSIYEGIYKLPQGSYLCLTGEKLAIKPCDFTQYAKLNQSVSAPREYWSARDAVVMGQSNKFHGSDEEALNALDSLLKDSIRLRMLSDVPLGAFLSGGIDSSLVVALMQAQSSVPVKTFSIGFHEQRYNEAAYAKDVAKHLRTDHTELYVSAKQTLEVIPNLANIYDEPFGDSSAIPTFLVSSLAKQSVTVSLSGDGGDELFGGYNRYLLAGTLWKRLRRSPLWLRKCLAKLIDTFSQESLDKVCNTAFSVCPKKYHMSLPGNKLAKLSSILGSTAQFDVYHRLVSRYVDTRVLLFGGEEARLTSITDISSWPQFDGFMSMMMYLDLVSFLPDDILVKLDRASMAVSLEAREPLLDYRVVEFAYTLPDSLKVRDGVTKWGLRNLLYRYVPKDMIERPKMGFGIPVGDWLRGPLKDWAEDLLSEDRIKRDMYVNSGEVRKMWDQHVAGQANWEPQLWDILMFQSWVSAWA